VGETQKFCDQVAVDWRWGLEEWIAGKKVSQTKKRKDEREKGENKIIPEITAKKKEETKKNGALRRRSHQFAKANQAEKQKPVLKRQPRNGECVNSIQGKELKK